jgi:hypothetical protein
LKFSKLVMRLGLWRWLMSLSLLHVGHSLLHDLQHLSLHYQNLLKCWWWRRVGIVVVVILIGTTVASVGHLMIMKRVEIELKIEIQHSPLYASRYNKIFIYITEVRLYTRRISNLQLTPNKHKHHTSKAKSIVLTT